MICQYCGRNEATMHINRIADGEATQLHMCSKCAEHLGYSNFLSGFGGSLSSILANFFPEFALDAPVTEESERCPQCGISFEEIVRNGMMGCPTCYDVFYSRLKPSISRIHGRTAHVGKRSLTAGEQTVTEPDRLSVLKAEMDEAIRTENFEKAAVIRDEIKTLRGDES